VVILPELAVCPTLRQEILEWLYFHKNNNFLLVVPGSFHEMVEPLTPTALPFNRTGLFSGQGDLIFWHDKFIPFGHEDLCDELIQTGNTVTLWLTPIGVISLAICRDFCEGQGWVRSLWETLAPDWVLVPSMTLQGGISAHLRQAEHLHRDCNTRVLVANQWPFQPYPNQQDSCEHGFAFSGQPGSGSAQEVTDTLTGRLKFLDLPQPVADK
jgi:predicted amidohydrolase